MGVKLVVVPIFADRVGQSQADKQTDTQSQIDSVYEDKQARNKDSGGVDKIGRDKEPEADTREEADEHQRQIEGDVEGGREEESVGSSGS